MKKKIISFMLSLVLLSTVVTPGTVAYATADDNGMEISKTATANDDGSYTITLEAYATGEKFISEVTEDVPTDIILVLDQSGSMDDAFDTITSGSYSPRNNSNMENYPYRQNGGSDNIWYKLSDGSFVRVSMRIKQNTENIEWKSCITYHPGFGDDGYVLWNGNMVDWSHAGVLYQLLDDGTYARCYVTGNILRGYTYTYADGTSEYVRTGTNPTQVDKSKFFYAPDGVTNNYDYFYVDADGNEVPIETSTGDNTKPTKTYYSLKTTSKDRTKLQALKDAVSQFSESVEKKAAATGVDHRIAVVGFASGKTWNGQNYNYNNTEVFKGASGYRYGSDAQGVYSTAFMDMNDPSDVANVTASIDALDADGGTLTDLGVEMANGIFNANPVLAGEKRNRVVVVFTDGQPGWSGYDSTVAQNAIDQAATTKNTYGATVYTVGIFEGANVNGTDKTNTFMRNLSSGNGYYLTASNSAALNNIFQQISNNIESGGSSTTLDAKAVIRDIIAPQFELPANATAKSIKLYTAESNGSVNSWKNKESFDGSVSLGTNDNSVSVSGFSFKDNWCGNQTVNGQKTFHNGKKLIIEFTVQPKAGFLGGNDVYTNTNAGIYENSTAEKPIRTFNRPTVNVPIKDVTVKANDKNVYLLGDVTAAQLKDGAEVKCGDVKLELNESNYGLDPWQTEYVNITVTVKDKNDNPISDKLADLTDDTTYTVEVTVSPKTVGTSTHEKGDAATAKTGVNDPAANIYVFKPELTFKDSEVYYGDTAPTDFSANLIKTEWKHGDTLDTTVIMIGKAPELQFEYKPESGVDASNKINTKKDIPVSVDVRVDGMAANESLNDFITFVHQACDPTCDWNETELGGNPAFLLHVKTCKLTITKQDGADGEPYVFDICKDGVKYSEVTIEGNDTQTLYELPVGNYTIVENEGWSWRYSVDNGGSAALTAQYPTGSITCTNTKTKDQWLNGFSNVEKNIFGVNHNN